MVGAGAPSGPIGSKVGTNKSMVLVYDFDENRLINEIALPNNAVEHGISMISAPLYPLILCGVGTVLKKFELREEANRCVAPPTSDDKLQLDGIHGGPQIGLL